MDFKSLIREIPDYPKEGILFRDITTLIKDGEAYAALTDAICKSLQGYDVDAIIGAEARGFIIGAPVAYALGKGFIPARKPGKLPCDTEKAEYALEYGTACLEIHSDAIQPGMRIAVVDDLIATGGTAKAICDLVQRLGANVVALRFAVELEGLDGREVLSGYDVDSIIKY